MLIGLNSIINIHFFLPRVQPVETQSVSIHFLRVLSFKTFHCLSLFSQTGPRTYPSQSIAPCVVNSKMTSPDDDYGQTSNNTNTNAISVTSTDPHNNYNRRINSNSSNPYPTSPGMELRLLMTSRDAGAVIGTSEYS